MIEMSSSYVIYAQSSIAQIIKTKRQIVGLKLTIRKTKQPSHQRALTSARAVLNVAGD